jgi:hypothetical protein
VTIKTPSPNNFRIERYDVTDATRNARARMMMDLIAKKRKFIFKYPVITGPEMDIILSVIDTEYPFMSLEYIQNDVTKYATVYAGAKPSDLYRTGAKWIWTNVEFSLIEQ